jgi:hypothetical protein
MIIPPTRCRTLLPTTVTIVPAGRAGVSRPGGSIDRYFTIGLKVLSLGYPADPGPYDRAAVCEQD